MESMRYAGLAAVLVLAVAWAVPSSAGTIDLVENGEFEVTDGVPFTNTRFTLNWPNWSSINATTFGAEFFEIWEQGAFGSPSLGSDGQPTGNHLELWENSLTDTDVMSVSADALPTATVSFDYWWRTPGNIFSFAVINTTTVTTVFQQILGPGTPNGTWEAFSQDITITPGDDYILSFFNFLPNDPCGPGNCGPHIDQVSFLVTIPEPPYAGLAVIAGVAAFPLRKKRARRGRQSRRATAQPGYGE